MNLWQKMIIDWLCALGDWLWANLVVALATFLRRLTFRRIVLFAGLAVLTIAFAQVFTADIAIIFAGDMMLYFDIASMVMFIVARQRLRQILPVVADAIQKIFQNGLNVLRRLGSRQHRNANATKRKLGADGSKQSDDEPAAWSGAEYAFA
jgi:hypothetical protein